nr:unnamed protein product [Digitaria exilis]
MGDLGGDWREAAAEEDPAPAAAGGGPDHLVVMVHGIVGSTADWKFGAEQFDKLLSGKVIVHCSNRNMHKLTLDGIDVMGERLAQEVIRQVIEEIDRRPHIKKISFVAHSVGGLVARYAIGRLYRPPKQTCENTPQSLSDSSRGTIHGLEAINFITVASPHLGSRGNKQAFRRRVAYSNVRHDHIVGWRTSSIRQDSELPKWVDSTNKIYPHIVHEELSKAEAPDQCADTDNCTLEERLLRGLKRVSWEKVDVSFHNSKVRSAAHSVIQVKDPVMHCEGADVIQHMIDHFTL